MATPYVAPCRLLAANFTGSTHTATSLHLQLVTTAMKVAQFDVFRLSAVFSKLLVAQGIGQISFRHVTSMLSFAIVMY